MNKDRYFQEALSGYTNDKKLRTIIECVMVLYTLHDLQSAAEIIMDKWSISKEDVEFIMNLKEKIN